MTKVGLCKMSLHLFVVSSTHDDHWLHLRLDEGGDLTTDSIKLLGLSHVYGIETNQRFNKIVRLDSFISNTNH